TQLNDNSYLNDPGRCIEGADLKFANLSQQMQARLQGLLDKQQRQMKAVKQMNEHLQKRIMVLE
ncbi:hypothetical protein, partial [Vibrio breoganii]|uniref:hypothetical protein n=1 Tax=Vibrio breoganii TaxID=553239 RepID=UPI001A7E1561